MKKNLLFFFSFFLFCFEISFSQNISVNTTGAANSTSSMFEVLQGSGTSGTSGLFVRHSGSPTTAYGLWVEMTGAPTNKYAIVVPSGSGNVGIGTTTPILPLHAISNANTAPLYLKSQSTYDAFSILPWNGVTYLSAGVYYNNGAWVHDAATTSNELIAMQPNAGVLWYNSNNSAGSWNVASGVTLWNTTGYWKNLVQSTAAGNSYFTGGNLGIGTASPGYLLDVQGGNLNVGTTYGTNVIYGNHGSVDTRATNPNPETYNMGVINEFKQNSSNGLNDGGSFNAVMSFRQWSSGTDWSGGGTHQLGFTQNGNIWHRYSQTTGSWGPWYELLSTANGGVITCASNNYVVKSNGTNGVCSQIYDNGTNVGIGTAGPGKKLDVQGGTSFGSGTFQSGAVTDIGNAGVDYPGNSGWAGSYNTNLLLSGLDYTTISFHDAGATVGELGHVSNSFFFDGGQAWGPVSLGINTRSPNLKFEVLSGNSDGIVMGQQADNTNTIQTYIDGQWTNRATYAGGCCNVLALEPDVGSVGIGTLSPGYKLDVVGDIRANGGWLRNNGQQGWYNDTYGSGLWMTDGSWIRSYGSAGLWFNSATIGTNGNFSCGYGGAAGPTGGGIFSGTIGVGTSAPATSNCSIYTIDKLNVYSTTTADNGSGVGGSVAEFGNSSTTGLALIAGNNSASDQFNGLEGFTQGVYSGVLGLHLSTTSTGYGVKGKTNSTNGSAVGVWAESGGGSSWALWANGKAGGTGGWNVSDARTKKNIVTIENALDKILKLRGVEYEFNFAAYPGINFPEGKHLGFIAQEVEGVVKDAVIDASICGSAGPDKIGGRKNVNEYQIKMLAYNEIIPLLTEAVKEQQKMIVDLQNQVKELKSQGNH